MDYGKKIWLFPKYSKDADNAVNTKNGNKYFYPEVYYSKDVDRVLTSNPQLPRNPLYSLSASPSEPEEPIKPKAKKFYILLAFFTFFVLFTIVMFCLHRNQNGAFGLFVLLPLTVQFTLATKYYYEDVKDYQQRLERYKYYVKVYPKLVRDYEKYYSDYEKRQAEYDEKVKEMKTAKYVSDYRKDEMKRYLRERAEPIFENCGRDKAKKGVSEKSFAKLLKEEGFNVLLDKRVPVDDTFYYPDILIECDNIYIDIEIDEPYSGDDGEPIHYMLSDGTSADYSRNCHMNNSGFEVVRFAEESVVLFPERCIVFIRKVIGAIHNCNTGIGWGSIMVKKWTKEESSSMFKSNYRNTYLK